LSDQFLLPDGLAPGVAREALAAHLGVVDGGRYQRVERTFYDTFDGRLHRAGLALVYSGGRMALVAASSLAEHAGEPWKAPPARLLLTDLPDGRLRELLAPVVEVRAVMPIVRTRSRLEPLRLLNADEKTVVRLLVEDAAAVRPRAPLRSRVHVLPVRGYEKAAARLRRSLERDLGLVAAATPLQDEAVTAAGGAPGGVSSKLGLVLRPGLRADAAAVQVLQRLHAAIEANLPGTLADVDSEFLHDLRVAVRRTRALQRELRGVFPPGELARFRDGFRWLQAVTGPTRDLDVYLLEFERFRTALPDGAHVDLDPLERLLADRRSFERRRMVRALRSERARTLLAGWAAFLDGLVELPTDERPDAARPIREVAGARIARVYRRMVKLGDSIEEDGPPEALHELRKQGKELRYLLEFFASLFPARVTGQMVKSLKALQDILGRFQDAQVQATMLQSLREEVAAREGGAAALMAMGLLVDRLARDQHEARSHFEERFAAFASEGRRALVKETFE
jgi:CHAD domain-containing protein